MTRDPRIDPQPGDIIMHENRRRRVTIRNGGEIEYVNYFGRRANCWILTWQNWAKDAIVENLAP